MMFRRFCVVLLLSALHHSSCHAETDAMDASILGEKNESMGVKLSTPGDALAMESVNLPSTSASEETQVPTELAEMINFPHTVNPTDYTTKSLADSTTDLPLPTEQNESPVTNAPPIQTQKNPFRNIKEFIDAIKKQVTVDNLVSILANDTEEDDEDKEAASYLEKLVETENSTINIIDLGVNYTIKYLKDHLNIEANDQSTVMEQSLKFALESALSVLGQHYPAAKEGLYMWTMESEASGVGQSSTDTINAALGVKCPNTILELTFCWIYDIFDILRRYVIATMDIRRYIAELKDILFIKV